MRGSPGAGHSVYLSNPGEKDETRKQGEDEQAVESFVQGVIGRHVVEREGDLDLCSASDCPATGRYAHLGRRASLH